MGKKQIKDLTEEEGLLIQYAPATAMTPPAKPEATKDEWVLPELPVDGDVNEACKTILPDVVKMYWEIINDPEAPAAARIAAGKEITDRAVGKVGSGDTRDTAEKTLEEIFDELFG